VIGTEGRSFWVLDDVEMLYQLNGFSGSEDVRLSGPRTPTVSAAAVAGAGSRWPGERILPAVQSCSSTSRRAGR